MSALVSSSVRVAYGYYAISEPDIVQAEAKVGAQGTSNGLVAVVPGYAMVWTGTFYGRVGLTLDLRQDPPPVDLADWDEVVEVTLPLDAGQARIQEWGLGPRDDLPNLAVAGPGTYRLRCHARGRDDASGLRGPVDIGEQVDVIEEAHLLAIWPAPPSDVLIYQIIDQFGAQRRADAERRAHHQRQPRGAATLL
jgi:hypothetical protein